MAISDALSFAIGGTRPSANQIALLIFLGLLGLTIYWSRSDSREPPTLRPTIPIVGHLVGLIRQSHNYHREQFSRHKMPICTLPIFGGRLYVINSPELAQSAIRSRTLSFEPHVTEFIERMTDAGDSAMKIYRNPAFFSQWIKIVYSSLTGEHLLKVNLSALNVLSTSLNDIPQEGIAVPDLFLWTRNLLTLATTTSLMGSKNPWSTDKSLIDSYWYLERDIAKLMINFMPSMIAPQGYRGRVEIQDAMTEYFAQRWDTESDVPKFTKDRMELERSFGMTPGGMAGLEVAVIHGSLSNTIPTAYWMLAYVFSRPDLVEKLRVEANSVIMEDHPSHDGPRVVTIDIVRLEEKLPLAFSTLREVQRLISFAVLNRRIMADTTISDGESSYLLKKGNSLQISHGVTHYMPEVWGPTVDQFVPERFLDHEQRSPEDTTEADMSIAPGAYTPFGAGKHICPGRFFAAGEILGFIIPLVLGFEITNPAGRPIRVPEYEMPWMTTGLGKPVPEADLRALIKRRSGWESVVWKVATTNGSSRG